MGLLLKNTWQCAKISDFVLVRRNSGNNEYCICENCRRLTVLDCRCNFEECLDKISKISIVNKLHNKISLKRKENLSHNLAELFFVPQAFFAMDKFCQTTRLKLTMNKISSFNWYEHLNYFVSIMVSGIVEFIHKEEKKIKNEVTKQGLRPRVTQTLW